MDLPASMGPHLLRRGNLHYMRISAYTPLNNPPLSDSLALLRGISPRLTDLFTSGFS